MYNKIELENNGEPFTIKFNGMEYKVPTGLFEAEQTLGNFIKGQATKWGLNLKIKGVPQAPTVKKIEEDKIVSKETVKEEIKETVKKTVKK